MAFIQPTFVGREQLLDQYRTAISRYAQGQSSHLIWNLHAITGMGKTWFGRRLFADVTLRQQCNCAWISFEPGTVLPAIPDADSVPSVVTAEHAFREIFTKLAAQSNQESQIVLPSALADLPVEYELAVNSAKHLVVFFDAVNAIEQRLDATTSEEAWDALQEQIIGRLVAQGALVIAISQGPLVWTLWELHQASHPERLFPFEPEETAHVAQQYELEPSAGLIQELTFGHPASIAAIIRHHLEPEARPPFDWPALAAPEQTLRQRVEKLSDAVQRILLDVGVLRLVDVDTLKCLLSRLAITQDTHHSFPWRDLLAEFIDKELLTHDSTGRIFRFDPGLRLMVRRELRRPERFERYITICNILADWYLPREKMPKIVRTNASAYPANLIEWAYFSLSALQARVIADDSPPDESPDVATWPHLLAQVWQTIGHPTHRARMTQAFVNDPELRDLLEFCSSRREAYQAVGYDLDIQQEQTRRYVQIAFNSLFRQRLTSADICILTSLAKFTEGFDRDAMRDAIKSVHGEPSPSQVRAYLARFSQFAIVYRSDTRRFMMDSWLQQFLARALDEGIVAMGV